MVSRSIFIILACGTFNLWNLARNLLAIHEISGHFEHLDACLSCKVASRDARLPLHPSIRHYARSLLLKGVPGPSVYTQANTWAQIKYPPIQTAFTPDPFYRYTYVPHDTTSLYRTLKLEMGISQHSSPHGNINAWFRADSPSPPSPDLTAACLFYQPFVQGETDRFILVLSTPEQRQAAWQHGHHKPILADLTFGFCSARANLWILMVIDEHFRGIPVAYVIFSAKATTSRRGVHGDYNTGLLETILSHWISGMGTNSDGDPFTPYVGVTDNDTRERTAMTSLWPDISLLLCLFHTWQAWRAGLNRHIKGVPVDARGPIRSRLARLCMRL